jgi:hypothetical protein
MQLTRAVLAIALAAGTTSALPTSGCKSGECNNADHRAESNLEGVSHAVEQRFHHAGHSQDNVASDHGQSEEMNNSQGHITAQMNIQAHQQDVTVNSILNGNGQQSDRMLHVMKTPESHHDVKYQDSTRSSAYKNLPSIQQNSLSKPEKTAKTEANKAADNHGAAAASPNKSGFTLKVRELMKSYAQGREQLHRGSGQQNHEEHSSENSIGVRQDWAEAQPSSNEMNMDKDNSNMDQNAQAGMRQDQDVENRNQVPTTQNGDSAQQEVSRVSVPLSLKVARSHIGTHTGLSMSMAGHAEQESNANQANQENRDQVKQEQQNNPHNNNQMQSNSGMMECLRAARGDIHQYVSVAPRP